MGRRAEVLSVYHHMRQTLSVKYALSGNESFWAIDWKWPV